MIPLQSTSQDEADINAPTLEDMLTVSDYLPIVIVHIYKHLNQSICVQRAPFPEPGSRGR